MKLIFSTQGIKREIQGPFDLCASQGDLRALRDQIDRKLAEDFCYGWFTVWPNPECAEPNTESLPWAP